jgi:hypothetical protein
MSLDASSPDWGVLTSDSVNLRFSTAARRAGTALRRLTAVAVVVATAFLAFHLYIFGGDPLISAVLVVVAIVATALAF